MQPSQRNQQPYTEFNDEQLKTLGRKSTKDIRGKRDINVRASEQVHIDQAINDWSIEPYISNSDVLRPGSSMTDLNRILAQEEQTLTLKSADEVEDWTDLCLHFCSSVLHNITTKIDMFPLTARAFLKLVIYNTRED